MHGGDKDDTEDNVESPPSAEHEETIAPSPPANHPVAGTALVTAASAVAVPAGDPVAGTALVAAASAVAVPAGAAPAVSGRTNSTQVQRSAPRRATPSTD